MSNHCCCLVAKSCLTLCDPINCSIPSFPVLHCLLQFAQTYVHCQGCHPTISSSVTPFSSCPLSFRASGSVLMSQFFILSARIKYNALYWNTTKSSAKQHKTHQHWSYVKHKITSRGKYGVISAFTKYLHSF